MNEPILHHLSEASEGDRVLLRSREYQSDSSGVAKRYRTFLISRATKKRLYTRSSQFYCRETGKQLSAGFSDGVLVDPTNANVEAWRAWQVELERRKQESEAAKLRAERDKRKTLHQWAVSTLADIEALHCKADRIAALLDRGEQFFDLRQDL